MSLWSEMQADHDLVFELINQLTGGPVDPEHDPGVRQRIASELVALESVHEAAEELVIWPVVRRRCPDGQELIGEALSQERESKKTLQELRRISGGSEEFSQCANAVAADARSHISYEQNQIWPRLDDRVSEDEERRLVALWRVAKASGPTRPHPLMPASPVLLATAGRMVAGLDRARDAVLGRHVPASKAS